MRTVSIRMLGRFEVAVDGQVVSNDSWRSRRATDLVKLLALAPGGRLRREAITEALWPDLAPEAAAANLRKAAHYARRAAGAEDFVSAVSGVLELCASTDYTSDVEEFGDAYHHALATNSQADAARAADLYGGELLPDNVADHWTEADRERLRTANLQMLRAAGRWARVAELDPWDEAAHRALMREALAAGNRAEALRIYDALRARLADELGIQPTAATDRLVSNIRIVEAPDASPAAQVRSLIARGRLNYWGRINFAEVEQVALKARELALEAGLGPEVGEASTLLSTVGLYTGTWWDRFRADFRFALEQPDAAARPIFDALVCFTEFFLDAPAGTRNAAQAADEALAMTRTEPSVVGQALAHLMSGEVHLVSGRVPEAIEELEVALRAAEQTGWAGGTVFALHRLSEARLAHGDRPAADELARTAVRTARGSDMEYHVLVRAFDAAIRAASRPAIALDESQKILRTTVSCEPCGIGYLFAAIDAATQVGRLADARAFLEDAERVYGMWGGGPWQGALWLARGRIREAEGEDAIARVFYEEAARSYAAEGRPLDEARARAAASLSAP